MDRPTSGYGQRMDAIALPGRGRPFPVSAALRRLADAVADAGGRAIAVGGAVRDHLLGRESKDIDVEVYGLSLEALESTLATIGSVHAVGRSFGVLKVAVEGADETEVLDVALPRTESKSGRGHRGFVVEADPEMSFEDAARRRDFTMNALGVDLDSGALLDPHGGVAHLAAGRLVHVSEAFDEDPLRVLRGAQLAARFGLDLDADTVARCRRLQPELSTLPKERLYEELKKLLLRAPWPSVGFRVLLDVGALSLFPELDALRGCAQEAEWHPEGDVWIHTLLVVDAAAAIARAESLDEHEALVLTFGALCHDLGKPPTTVFERDRIRSPGHEAAGDAPTRAFLERLGAPHALVDDVVAVVVDHLKPFQLYAGRDNVSDGAIRRLATRVNIPRLLRVARADHFGRTTADALAQDDPAGPWLMARAAEVHALDDKPRPILLGRHLIALGHRPGPQTGALLNTAFDAQLDGAFDDEAGAEAWAAAHLPPEPST